MPLIIEMKDVVKPKLTLRVDGNHSIKLPPSLPAERMQQLIEFAKFIIGVADVKQTLRGVFEGNGILLHGGKNKGAKMYHFQENGWVSKFY
jgi:hypothetical protein